MRVWCLTRAAGDLLGANDDKVVVTKLCFVVQMSTLDTRQFLHNM